MPKHNFYIPICFCSQNFPAYNLSSQAKERRQCTAILAIITLRHNPNLLAREIGIYRGVKI